jgi:hypothetical protein
VVAREGKVEFEINTGRVAGYGSNGNMSCASTLSSGSASPPSAKRAWADDHAAGFHACMANATTDALSPTPD